MQGLDHTASTRSKSREFVLQAVVGGEDRQGALDSEGCAGYPEQGCERRGRKISNWELQFEREAEQAFPDCHFLEFFQSN